MKSYSRSLVWLRRDLRLSDHRAIHEAEKHSDEVIPVFVFDQNILEDLKDQDDRRMTFLWESLHEMKNKLSKKESDLLFLYGDPVEEIPKICKKLNIKALFYHRDYESYAKKRDLIVTDALEKEGVDFHSYPDHVIFEGSEILNGQNEPYKVFTPYKNAWLKKVTHDRIQEYKVTHKKWAKKEITKAIPQVSSLKDISFEPSPPLCIKSGEKEALKLFEKFKEFISSYDENRNYPFLDHGTSGLSVHLRFGTISTRFLFRETLKLKSKGAQTWVSELIWREFYQMILDQFPYVEKKEFKEKLQGMKWPGKKEHFEKWCEGQTGYPIVDAAMRELKETGWMHNRLRMIVASFLTKDLLISWKWGEEWFARQLLDFDLASNNGGWQWCASTGCDAQPYFRIFNPCSQSEKFDPDAEYILRWVPELKNESIKKIHHPEEKDLWSKKNYPEPIVDHSKQRDQALALFKSYEGKA